MFGDQRLGRKLNDLWDGQREYNERIMRERSLSDEACNPQQEYWAKQYLLGMMGEVDEVLREINWKAHRRQHPVVRSNLARELADMTKYLLCLWQLYGFTAKDMLDFATEKTTEMAQLYRQEFNLALPFGSYVVISDVDGTLGDWRKAFVSWCRTFSDTALNDDTYVTMLMEQELGLPYQLYMDLKRDFEEQGGYQSLEPFEDAVNCLQDLEGNSGVQILVYTARPFDRYSRLWSDTWMWLTNAGLDRYVRELRMGGEERITRAIELKAEGHPVVMLEDDPSIAKRAANAGVTVFLREWPYNQSMSPHNNIIRVQQLDAESIMAALEEQDVRRQ